MEQNTIAKNHKMILNNRKSANLTGVKDVISFDIKEVLLETSMGMLLIKGTDMKVSRLNIEKGELDIDGNIDSLLYSEVSNYSQKGKSVLKRMFK